MFWARSVFLEFDRNCIQFYSTKYCIAFAKGKTVSYSLLHRLIGLDLAHFRARLHSAVLTVYVDFAT